MGIEAIPPTDLTDLDHDAVIIRKSDKQSKLNTLAFLGHYGLLSDPPGLPRVDPEKVKRFIIDHGLDI